MRVLYRNPLLFLPDNPFISPLKYISRAFHSFKPGYILFPVISTFFVHLGPMCAIPDQAYCVCPHASLVPVRLTWPSNASYQAEWEDETFSPSFEAYPFFFTGHECVWNRRQHDQLWRVATTLSVSQPARFSPHHSYYTRVLYTLTCP